MNRALAYLLTRLYPRVWRERYGEEFETLLQDGGGGLHTSVNVLWAALKEHVFPTRGGNMDQQINSFAAIIKRPSAFLPLAMSLTALTMLLGVIASYWAAHGTYLVPREPDEGTVAHLWQLLMAGQLPIIAFFAIKWLPKAPGQTMRVLALHIGAALASMAPVFLLNL